MLKRIHPHKKWSRVYADGIEERERLQEANSRVLHDVFKVATARVVIARRFGRAVRNKMMLSGFSCKKTLENVKPPESSSDWKPHWGSQVMCCLCALPCLAESINCQCCNAVVHYNCLLTNGDITDAENTIEEGDNYEEEGDSVSDRDGDYHSTADSRGSSLSKGLYQRDGDRSTFLCALCIQGAADDKIRYENVYQKLYDDRVESQYQKLIAKRLLTYIVQRRYARKRRSLALLRTVIIKKVFQKKFTLWRRKQLRVLVIDVQALPQIVAENTIVIVTVVDTIQHTQLFRYDRPGLSCINNPILIPGMTAFMTIVVTVCSRRSEDNPNVCFPQYQAVFVIRDVRNFMDRRAYDIVFTPKIYWPPQEHEGCLFHVMSGAQLPINTNSQDSFTSTSGHLSSNVSPVSALSNNKVMAQTCRLYYCPQSPVLSTCAMVSAPPLEGLRRINADVGNMMNKAKQALAAPSINMRSLKWWICLRHLKLYFYINFGDPTYRYCADLREATIMTNRNVHQSSMMAISFPDGRKWLVDFDKRADMFQFEFAVLESQRAYWEQDSSIYIRSAELHRSFKDNRDGSVHTL